MLKAANEIRFIKIFYKAEKRQYWYFLIIYMVSKFELNPLITFFQLINIAKFD